MLQTINDKAKGWLAYLVVGLISVPFALFGINSYIGGSDKLVAATVNDEEISVREVQNALLQQKQRLASLFGGKLPTGFDDKSLKAQALEGLINQVLVRQEVENSGYRASDEEVFSIISSTQAFQKEGVFDEETYE
jgi:peptidyl-prolyl cis-trans isomerase D